MGLFSLASPAFVFLGLVDWRACGACASESSPTLRLDAVRLEFNRARAA